MRILLIAALSSGVAVAATPDDRFEMPIHRDARTTTTIRFAAADNRTVDLRSFNGTIEVTAERRNDVELAVARHTDAERELDLPDAERHVRLESSSSGSSVNAVVHDREQVCGESTTRQSDAWWDRPRYVVRVDLVARVPEGSRIRLCTINGDHVIATGPFSDFDVSNVNGRIELSGLRGSGRATTVNGAVHAAFDTPPRDASEFHTVNGNVVVTFPADLAATLRLKTFRGDLLTDFDVQPLPVQATPTRDRRNGRFVYRTGGMTSVQVGRGGPELRFETLNGDVRILRRARQGN